LVTVLTPATTFTVGEDFSQNCVWVNTSLADICCFSSRRNPKDYAIPRCWSGI
jgi:hypothetical protein